MKIKSMRIENFRSFQDDAFELNRYSCFVGQMEQVSRQS